MAFYGKNIPIFVCFILQKGTKIAQKSVCVLNIQILYIFFYAKGLFYKRFVFILAF